jgi:hypothetical protein
VQTPDGAVSQSPVMRRKNKGAFEYKKMSKSELDDYLQSDAW